MDETAGELKPVSGESREDTSAVPYTGRAAMQTTGADNREPELNELRARIEQTEVEMIGTLNAIQDKLSFENMMGMAEEKILETLLDKVKSMMKDINVKSKDIGHMAMDTVKQHPVPVALLGLGLGLLLMRGMRSSSEERQTDGGWSYSLEHGESLPEDIYQSGLEEPGGSEYREGGNLASGHGMRIGETMSRLKEKASEASHKVGEFAGQLRGKAKGHRGESQQTQTEQAEEHERGFSQVLKATPFTIGAAAFALGLLIGMAAPGSRRERKILGGTRETLKEKAKELGHTTMEKVEHVFGRATDAAKQEAEKQGFPM